MKRAIRIPMMVVAVGLTSTLPAAVDTPITADATAAASAPEPKDERAAPRLIVTRHRLPRVRVPATIVGGNQRWRSEADHAWDKRGNHIRKRIVTLAKRAGMKAVRYPGGTVANIFEYTHATGKPGCQTSGGFADPWFAPIGPANSEYTIGRHSNFLDGIGGRTNLMIPMINTTTRQAVRFVQAVRKATGQQHFVVEIGNEPYLENQRYWRGINYQERLEQYIRGGRQAQPAGAGKYANNRGLYRVGACDLRHPARASGRANQTYRPRFNRIARDPEPVVLVSHKGKPWTRWSEVQVLKKHGAKARVFKVTNHRTRIQFGDGVHGRRPPKGAAMRIRYTAGPMPGFSHFYRALSKMKGVQVCSSWARDEFVARMRELNRRYDCLAVHAYANTKGNGSAKGKYNRVLNAGRQEARDLATLRRQMRTDDTHGTKGRFLIVTEFGSLDSAIANQGGKFVHDMLLAQLLIGQVKSGVRVSNLSNFASFFERYKSAEGPRFTLSSRAYVENMFRRMVGQQPVKMATDGAKGVVVLGTRRAPGKGALLVINRRWDAKYEPRIALPGRTRPACVSVRPLRIGPYQPTRPDNARQLPKSVRGTWKFAVPVGATKTWTFRSHSITLLTFRPRGDKPCPVVRP